MATENVYQNMDELFADFDLTTPESQFLLKLDKMHPEPQIHKINSRVFVAQNYSLGNTMWIVTPKDTIVAVDCPENIPAAERILVDLRKIPEIGNKPISTLIYTVFHFDHVIGARALVNDPANKGVRPNIIGHKHLIPEALVYDRLKFIKIPRTAKMSGYGLPRKLQLEAANAHLDGPSHLTEPPNDILDLNDFGEMEKRNIDGLEVVLYHLPGYTKDQIVVWLPEFKLVHSSDIFAASFPNLYTVRVEPPRDALGWAASARFIRNLKPDVLIAQHQDHFEGAELIANGLEKSADAMQFIHDQTVRLMAKGLTAEEIAERIRIPESLAKQPFLNMAYGMPYTGSKAIVDHYVGWFSGHVEDLFTLNKVARSKKMLKAFGRQSIMDEAKEAYKNGDYQWSLELSSAVYVASDRSDTEALYWRSNAVKRIAEKCPSSPSRQFLLTSIACDWDFIKPPALQHFKVRSVSAFPTLPIVGVLDLLKCHLDCDKAADVTLTKHLKISDAEVYLLEIRNGILYTEKVDQKNISNDTIVVDLSRLQRILSTEIPLTSTECPAALRDFLQYFDLSS